jgi:hypothetical protein
MATNTRHPSVEQSTGLIPFVVGVTGHRDLREEDLPALRQAVRSVLEQIAAPLRNTPILLLTALAEGADQIAAEVALDIGIEIAVVLPMALKNYLTTLSTDKARKDFHTLNDQAIHRIVLPAPHADHDHAKPDAASDKDLEHRPYRQLAAYLARHSHSLIALWDGSVGEPGGTFEVLAGFHSASPENAHADAAWAFTISTPRIRHTEPLAEPFAILRWDPETQHSVKSTYTPGLITTGIERFNREAVRLSGRAQPSDSLFPTPYAGPSTPFLHRVDSIYRTADALAVNYHKNRDHWIVFFLIVTLLPIAGLEAHGDLAPDWNFLYFAYPGGFFLVWLLFLLVRRKDEERRFPDFRVFAERLRVQFYWAFSGIPNLVNDQFEFPEDFEPGWICAALRGLFLFSPLHIPSSMENLNDVLHSWVIAQGTWFKGRTGRQRKALHRKEKTARVLFACLLTLALLVALVATLPIPLLKAFCSQYPDLREHLHFVIVMSTFALGLFGFWIEQAGFEELARSYYRMSQVFSRGASELSEAIQAADEKCAVSIVRSLGAMALRESSSWLIMRRERAIEIHL